MSKSSKKPAQINIQGLEDITDPFYRYTMTKLNVVRQKNKTVIDNLAVVGKELDRNSQMIVGYFKNKLSISMTYKNDVLSMAADINYERFEGLLREFIQEYVLCGVCKLPETVLIVGKTSCLQCKCCSHKTELKN